MRNNAELTLRKQSDFNNIYKNGKSRVTNCLVIIYKKNKYRIVRTGFVASKKVGNSVKRNRARRLMRVAYTELSDRVSFGYDIIFVARNNIYNKSEKEVQKSMLNAMEIAGLIKQE